MQDQHSFINLSSSRAKKARAAVVLKNSMLRFFIGAVAVFIVFFWLYGAFVSSNPIAHLLLIVLPFCIVPLGWYAGELKSLKQTQPITPALEPALLLDTDILGRLHSPVTWQQLLGVCMKQPGGWFYASRFNISEAFITNLQDPLKPDGDIQSVWAKAVALTAMTPEATEITASHLVAAFILSAQNHEMALAQLKLDDDDIVKGLQWNTHIASVYEKSKTRVNSGGIGRDLSFGWTPQLSRLGNNITEKVSHGHMLHRHIEGHNDVLKQMMHLLSQPGRRNAVLVGEVGVGKTTLVYALAQRLITAMDTPKELKYRQIVELNASTLISRTKQKGELESLLIRIIYEAIHAKNVILFLDEAQLFLADGTGSVDISNILLQVLEGGGLQIILSLDSQQWLQLGQTNPGLAQLMNRVVVSPLEEQDTMRVMEDQILLLENRNKVVYMYESLKEAFNLSERFIRDQAFPGKAIRLLEAAAGFSEQTHFITAKSVQQAVEKNFDVKIQTASTQDDRDKLLHLEETIHKRMINQTRAVKVVSDALRRARAGVRNNKKPIGTFLFLGPTGVGKTELSKALADAYFGGEDRIVRVDLNEFSQASDVTRLLENAAENTNSLTAQIAKQPFSVVLLDEIEKAHPNVLNTLLQLLDEGILKDTSNKPVSFRDAIIVATTNAGADQIRAHIEAGEQIEQFEQSFMDELINSNVFRPEFINRFDETVLFRPLTLGELTQVVDLLLNSINKTLAAQKISVTLSPEAKSYLAQAGYDPRLGARPLRRVVQRSIENIVAQRILAGTAQPGTVIALTDTDIASSLQR